MKISLTSVCIIILTFFEYHSNAQLNFILKKDSNINNLTINSLNDSISQIRIELNKRTNNIKLLNSELENVKYNIDHFSFITTYFKNPIKEFISNDIHRPKILELPVGNNDNQNTHPDILYTPKGFGPNRYKYWLCFTPYPTSNDTYENPCIYAGYDGINWEIPNGLTNPIISKPKGNGDHNADPDISFNADSSEIWIYFEQKINSPFTIYLLRTKSKDGISWSEPDTILKSHHSYFISPSIVYDNEEKKYYMWSNNHDQKTNNNFELRESTDGKFWSDPIFCDINGDNKYFRVWHHDIRKAEDFYEALFTLQSDHMNLYYGRSYNRDNWIAFKIMQPQYDFERGYLYRSTFLPIDSLPGTYHIWYSAWSGSTTNIWRISDFFAKIENDQIEFYDTKIKTLSQNESFETIELHSDLSQTPITPISFTLFYPNSLIKGNFYIVTDSSSFNNQKDIQVLFDNEYIYFSSSVNSSILQISMYDFQGKFLLEKEITHADRILQLAKNECPKNQPLIIRVLTKSNINGTIYSQSYKLLNP